ncbi:probable glutamate receptor [Uloborus diversus]|uniref:probable glutamate receptor n=1 Tax=Uloborus diversus TaxID=327109 RepID=UPI00240A7A00|nr:probable glutamate receptor [Uloborus diversus]
MEFQQNDVDVIPPLSFGLRWYNEGSLTHRRFLSSTLYYDICTQTSVSATKALELNDLFAAFVVLITGIVSSVWNPYSILRKDQNNVTYLDGIARDVYETMERSMNFKYELKMQPDLVFGSVGPNETWSGMIGSMLAKETDISGPYFITTQRASVVDFSQAFLFSEQGIVSGLVPASKDPLVWLWTIFAIMIATCTAFAIYALHSKQKTKRVAAFFKFFWLFYGTLLGKDIGSTNGWVLRNVLTAASFRFLIAVWMLGPVLVLMYTYQGAITSTFASNRMKPRIDNMMQLFKDTDVELCTLRKSYPADCLKKLIGTEYESLWHRAKKNLKPPPTETYPPWLDEVEDGKCVFVAETLFMKSIVGQRFKETGKCALRVTPTDFCTAYIAFAFRRNFAAETFRKFDQRLLWYNEGRLERRELLESLADYDVCARQAPSATRALKFGDLSGAFLVLGVGAATATITLLLEIMVFRSFGRKNKIHTNNQ